MRMVGKEEFIPNLDEYEFTPSQLLEFIGLKNTTEVQARLKEISIPPRSLINSKSIIPDWGITPEQFSAVVRVLKPKIKPKKFFTDHLGDEFRVELADIDFFEAWLRNKYGDDLTIYINRNEMITAGKVLSLYRELNTLIVPEPTI